MSATSCIVFSCADPHNPVPVGRFAIDDAAQGRFGYGLRYLERQDAFELDPIHLPLTQAEIAVPRRNDATYGVLSDAGPNAWGTQLALRLLREADEAPPRNLIEWFLKSGSYGSGCLGFSSNPGTPPHPGPVPSSSRVFRENTLHALDAYVADPDAHLDANTATLLFPAVAWGAYALKPLSCMRAGSISPNSAALTIDSMSLPLNMHHFALPFLRVSTCRNLNSSRSRIVRFCWSSVLIVPRKACAFTTSVRTAC